MNHQSAPPRTACDSPRLPRARVLLGAALLVLSASGAQCPQLLQQYKQPIPRALPPAATLEQIMDAVNSNSARVQSLYTTKATISTPGMPSLRTSIAYQPRRNFRLRAETALTGPEVDLGSNEELFWFWIRRNQPPALLFCRHEQFAASPARRMIPVEPEWLIQALGVVTFDGSQRHEGPAPVQAGRVQIRSTPLTPGEQGNTRITVVDETRGIVLEQHVYDAGGQRVASASMSRHVHDASTSVTLPRRVQVQWPAARFELTIDLNELQINRAEGNPPELWIKPSYAGYQEIDLARPPQREETGLGLQR